MRMFSVRRVVRVTALAVAAFGTISLVSATQDPLAAPTATATPSPTATIVASTTATAAPTPAPSPPPTPTATPQAPTATATPTPSPVDPGITRVTDPCTNADIQIEAEPPILVERVALDGGGSRVTVQLEPSSLVAGAIPYTASTAVSKVVELGNAEDVAQTEMALTFASSGGTLTLTYSLNISADAASATLSQVSGYCSPKR